MRLLLLGGIGEAARLARRLSERHELIYSLAGRTGRAMDLSCRMRVGGFGGADGLAAYLTSERIELLLDVTHPYAAQISRNAAIAANKASVPLWAYRRPPWRAEAGDDWREAADWAALSAALADFQQPFFTIGLEPLAHSATIPPGQHWLARCLDAQPEPTARLTVLNAIGPFRLEDELDLLRRWRIDVLVSKNSGGSAVAAKLVAARTLQIPVLMLQRPVLPAVDREFTSVEALAACLEPICVPSPRVGEG